MFNFLTSDYITSDLGFNIKVHLIFYWVSTTYKNKKIHEL